MKKSDIKHIALVGESLVYGGIATFTMSLARGLQQSGHIVDIIGLDNHLEVPVPEHVFIASCPVERPKGGPVSHYLRQSIDFCKSVMEQRERETGKYDLILVSGDLGLRAAKDLDSDRTYFIVHGSPMHIPKTKFNKLMGDIRFRIKRIRLKWRLQKLLNNRKLVFVSKGLKQYFDDSFAIRAKESHVIYNPFDLDRIRRLAGTDTPQRRSLTNHYVACSGRFTDGKAFDQAVRAFAFSGLDGDLVLVGYGEEENHIREVAKEVGVGERLKIIPFHENHFSVIAGARAFLHASLYEALGNVIVEALVLNVPVVAYDCPGGVREIVAPHQAGALAPVGDFEKLGRVLKKYVTHPYEIRQDVLECFGTRQTVEKYLSLIP